MLAPKTTTNQAQRTETIHGPMSLPSGKSMMGCGTCLKTKWYIHDRGEVRGEMTANKRTYDFAYACSQAHTMGNHLIQEDWLVAADQAEQVVALGPYLVEGGA